MARTFYRKKFSNYLGEQRALDDIVVAYTANPTPTPTPSITPSQTPTGTPTATPNSTSTPTPTITPTPTDPRDCRTYNIVSFGFTAFNWTNCDGTPGTIGGFGINQNICAKQGSVSQSGAVGTITDIGTCPLPTPTPTQTNTSTPTPSVTTTNTPTVTNTPSPTATPNSLCPQQLILSASSPSYLYGLYNRATIYTGGTFETAWYNFDDNIMNYGTNPDGNDYVAFSINSGSDYTSLYWSSDIIGGDGNWTLGYSTGNTLFNGGTLISSIILDTNSLVDGSLFFPPNGFLQYNGGYINYPASCPTPTPTATVTNTPTPSSTATAFSPTSIADLQGYWVASSGITTSGVNTLESWGDVTNKTGSFSYYNGIKATYESTGFGVNNLPYIHGNSGTYITNGNWSATTESTVYIVCSVPNITGGVYNAYMECGNYPNSFLMMDTDATSADRVTFGFTTSETNRLDLPINTPCYLRARWDGVQNLIRLDNDTEISTGNVVASLSSNPIWLFSRFNQNLRIPFDVAEIIIYNRYLNSSELTQLDTYITNKYSI